MPLIEDFIINFRAKYVGPPPYAVASKDVRTVRDLTNGKILSRPHRLKSPMRTKGVRRRVMQSRPLSEQPYMYYVEFVYRGTGEERYNYNGLL